MKKILSVALLLAATSPVFAVTQQEAEANPSDGELNRTYAIEMLAEGNLSEALAGIERAIIALPTDIPARFFRAKVLVLLGRGDEVKDELQFITTLKLAPSDLDEAKKLLSEIEQAGRSFSGSISVQAGIGYTDNANSWSKTGMQYGSVALTSLYNEDKKADTTYKGAVIFSGKNTLNDSKTLALKYTAGGTTNQAVDSFEKDMKVTLGSVGLEYESKRGLILGLKAGVTRIDRNNKVTPETTSVEETLYTDINSTKYSLEIGKKYDGGTKVSYIYSDTTDDHKLGATPDNSDSQVKGHELRLFTPISQSALLSASMYTKESRADLSTDAAKRTSNKDTTGYSLKLFHILAPGHLMTYGYTSSETDFLTQNVPSTTTKRADEASSLSVSYRIDGDKLWAPAKDWKISFGVSRSDSDSNYKAAAVEATSYDITASRVFDM